MNKLIASALVAFLLGSPAAFSAPAPAPAGTADSLPELEAARAAYLRGVTSLHTARDTRVAGMTKSYLTGLERLQKDITARGDLEGALQVKAELERSGGGQEPSAEERKVMPPALVTLRHQFELARDPVMAGARQQEEQETKAYVAALEALQKRLTTQNLLDKALLVKAEREKFTSVTDKTGASATGPIIAPTAPTTGAAARLEATLADKVAAAVSAHTYTLTENSEGPGGWQETPKEGALLVGFEFLNESSLGAADVRSIRPYYLTREAIVAGKDRGELLKVTDKVMARAGYAVAGLLTYQNSMRIQGIQVIFAKIDMRTGRLDLSPANSYKSRLSGSRGKGAPKQLGGDGRFVIGVYGKTGADADTIGLIQMP